MTIIFSAWNFKNSTSLEPRKPEAPETKQIPRFLIFIPLENSFDIY